MIISRVLIASVCLCPPFYIFRLSRLMAGQLGRCGLVGSVLGARNVQFRTGLPVAGGFLARFLCALAVLFASLSPSGQPIWLAWTF